VDFMRSCGTPWRTLGTPEYLTREVMTTGQLLRCEVKMKIPVSPTNPDWEEWECKAQGLNLADTVQKAALEALTTFWGKHLDSVAGTAAKVIHVPERHTEPWVECEASLSAQGNSHYCPDLVTSVRFFWSHVWHLLSVF
jgi:hypothetical protein